MNDSHSIDLSLTEIELISTALQTQEKILMVQSRAGGKQAKTRLAALQSLQRRFQPTGCGPRASIWSRLVGALTGRSCVEA